MAELTTPETDTPRLTVAQRLKHTAVSPARRPRAARPVLREAHAAAPPARRRLPAQTRLCETVRERYAVAARAAIDPTDSAGCGSDGAVISEGKAKFFGAGLYADDERDELPDTALLASLGCGNPTAMVDLRAGETVLDLGSGGGIDVLLSARRVGPAGSAYGLDMTDEILDLARANQAKAGIGNVHWLKGHIEAIPLPAGTVDVVLTNCVINLSTDKPRVLRETTRVLKPGGRLAISDVIADPGMDDATRADLAQYVGCIAGALTHGEHARHLTDAGLTDIEMVETHRVHEQAGSAIIRAASRRSENGVRADARVSPRPNRSKDHRLHRAQDLQGQDSDPAVVLEAAHLVADLNGHSDHAAPLGPRAVIVADVEVAEEA